MVTAVLDVLDALEVGSLIDGDLRPVRVGVADSRLRRLEHGKVLLELVGQEIPEGVAARPAVVIDEHGAHLRLGFGLDVGPVHRPAVGITHMLGVAALRAEQLVEVVTDLLRRRHHRDEVPTDGRTHGVLCGEVVGIGGGDHRGPELPLDGQDMVLPGQRHGQDLARGGIHPVGVEIDELEVVFACHPSNGVDIAHLTTIGRLVPEIEPESNCFTPGPLHHRHVSARVPLRPAVRGAVAARATAGLKGMPGGCRYSSGGPDPADDCDPTPNSDADTHPFSDRRHR